MGFVKWDKFNPINQLSPLSVIPLSGTNCIFNFPNIFKDRLTFLQSSEQSEWLLLSNIVVSSSKVITTSSTYCSLLCLKQTLTLRALHNGWFYSIFLRNAYLISKLNDCKLSIKQQYLNKLGNWKWKIQTISEIIY